MCGVDVRAVEQLSDNGWDMVRLRELKASPDAIAMLQKHGVRSEAITP